MQTHARSTLARWGIVTIGLILLALALFELASM